VETEFFRRWWENRPQYQTLVKSLVASGQLEFVNGGSCMHDEANPDYVSMIDQTTVGHRWLQETLGVTPKATWQIDRAFAPLSCGWCTNLHFPACAVLSLRLLRLTVPVASYCSCLRRCSVRSLRIPGQRHVLAIRGLLLGALGAG